MLRTIVTERLGIEHPIVCGGMTATGSAELAAGVSNAGCLGMLTALHSKTPDRLEVLIRRTRELTDRPFAVNLTILGEKRGAPEYPEEYVSVIVRNRIKVVETCGGGVPLMSRLHKALRAGGVTTIISKVVSVRSALVAQDRLGADMVSLMGFDSGGLPGEGDATLFINLPLAKRKLRIPYLASGGIATGRQIVAALALGAAGVQIGTRFNATEECNIFPAAYKERMVAADDRGTVMLGRPLRASSRVLRNKTADEVSRIEREKGTRHKFTDVAHLIGGDTQAKGFRAADPDLGVWNCGQSVALIDDVPTCDTLVRRLVAEANAAVRELLPVFSAVAPPRL